MSEEEKKNYEVSKDGKDYGVYGMADSEVPQMKARGWSLIKTDKPSTEGQGRK